MTTRRNLLKTTALATLATPFLSSRAQMPRAAADPNFVVKNGRIRQSIMGWCFNPMPVPELAKHCKDIGLVAMEGIGPDHYPAIKELGLDISLVGSHGFKDGPCNPENTDMVVKKLTDAVDLAKSVNSPSAITFTGMKFDGMDPDKAAQRCVDTWKKVMPHAEKNGVTIVLEHLNSRDDSHPMKGHPGYFGDHVDFCFDLVRRVGSPNFKLLFDIYHVSVMDGDVIRRIRQNHELIGHYHTAGNPGRAELDDTQEINYPAVLREIVKTGYKGFVAQEFIPTWDDPVAALRHAAQLCDV